MFLVTLAVVYVVAFVALRIIGDSSREAAYVAVGSPVAVAIVMLRRRWRDKGVAEVPARQPAD